MNPNAKPFVFRPAAQEWTPSWAPPAAPAQAVPVPAPEPEPIVEPLTPPAADIPPPAPSTEQIAEAQANDDDLDENDPLWIAVLELAKGDRKEALKMLEDPDALMSYPEIAKIMEGEGGDVDDGQETKSATVDDWDKVSPNKDGEAVTESRPSKAATIEANDDVEELSNDAEVEIDGDPRDHMNIVFIGHVDAGKSTLSGSILYLMGKVDARTIERFEKEAKQRNRESWFLAFIMVRTSSSLVMVT
jgi:hypothetical protein